MSYAKSRTFYGWTNKDCFSLVEKITDMKNISKLTFDKNTIKTINSELEKIDKELKFDVFKAGLGSDESIAYVRIGKELDHMSCDSDDISEASYTLAEFKGLLDMSFQFDRTHSKPTAKLPKPKLYNLVVADDK